MSNFAHIVLLLCFLIVLFRGGCLAVNVTLRILELRNGPEPVHLPLPTAVVLNYAALDFNFTSWMSNENLRILKSEQQTSTTEGDLLALREVVAGKDHLRHVVSLKCILCSN